MPIQGNMFNPRQSYAKPSAKTQFMRQQMGSLFYPQGSQQPNLQTAPQRSMLPNPIAPAAADARANAQFMQANPGFGTSSLDATQRFGGMTANNAFQSSMVNGYVGQANPMVPFNEAASRARAMEQVQRGVLPAERGGSYGRFADGGALGPGSAYAQSGGTPWQEQYLNNQREQRQALDYATSQGAMAQRLLEQDPMDWNQNVFTRRQPDGSLAYTDKLTALKNMPDEPGRAAAIEIEASARRENTQRMSQRLQDYKDKNAGLSPRQVRRERLQTQREDNRMRKAIMQGMNPMSPQATAMFPEASARFQQNMQKQKPSVAAMQNPIAPGSVRTTQSMQDADTVMTTLATTDPFMASLGAQGREDNSIAAVNAGLQGLMQSQVEPSPADLKSLRAYAQAVKHRAKSGQDPWDVYAPQVFDDLVNLPEDASEEDLRKWWEKYKQRPNMGNAAAAGPPSGNMPYFPPGTPIGR